MGWEWVKCFADQVTLGRRGMFSELFLILASYSPSLIDGDMKKGPSGDEILNSLLFPLSSLTGLTLPLPFVRVSLSLCYFLGSLHSLCSDGLWLWPEISRVSSRSSGYYYGADIGGVVVRSICWDAQLILFAYMPFTFVMTQTIQATYGSPFHSVDQRATVYLTFLSFTLLNICPTSHFSPGTRTLGYKEHRKEVSRIMILHWIEHSTKTYKNKKLRHDKYRYLSWHLPSFKLDRYANHVDMWRHVSWTWETGLAVTHNYVTTM